MTPVWVDWMLGISAAIATIGALVRWVIRPSLRAGMTFEALIPLIPTLIEMAKADGNGPKQLAEIQQHLNRQDRRLEKIEEKLL